MMMNERLCNALHGLKPTIMMVLVQFSLAGVNICYKLASNDGMSSTIIIAYRFLFASAFITPLAFFLERGKRPKLTWSVLFYAFLCGFFGGSLTQNLYVQSLTLTSVTFAAAMGNLVPGITFIMAVSFRLEKLNIRTMAGKAKVIGTVMGIGGAMFLTFYKGFQIHIGSTHINLLRGGNQHLAGHVSGSNGNFSHQLLGSLFAVGSCLSYAFWLIVQAKMSERYPCHYSSTALMCMMGSIQAVGFALCVERDWNQWKLGWNIRLLVVSYTGLVASGVMITLISWCVRMRGPLFVSVFTPLSLVLVAIAGSLLLEEKLFLGCVIGSVLIVCGLYIVLWGKSKEMKKISQLTPSGSFEHNEQPSSSQLTQISISSPFPKTTNNVLESNQISNQRLLF